MGGSINGSDIWTYTYAEGTRIDCDRYANVTDFGDSASCDKVATGFGVTTDNLVHWNPYARDVKHKRSLLTTWTVLSTHRACLMEN